MASATTAASASNLLSVHRHVRLCQIPTYSNCLQSPLFSKTLAFPTLCAQFGSNNPIQRRLSWQIGASISDEEKDERSYTKGSLFDGFLSVAEVLCIVPPAMYSIGCLISNFLPTVTKHLQFAPTNELSIMLPTMTKQLQFSPTSELFASQCFLLLGAVVIGSLIRRRQWQRVYERENGGSSVDLVSRIEKVEDDLKSSVRISIDLSDQIEKLGIPIAETAALEQKNSEETKALTAKTDLLEKELREILHILLAMQDQQRKQLQLILAIGQARRVVADEKQDAPAGENNTDAAIAAAEELEKKELELQFEVATQGGNDTA